MLLNVAWLNKVLLLLLLIFEIQGATAESLKGEGPHLDDLGYWRQPWPRKYFTCIHVIFLARLTETTLCVSGKCHVMSTFRIESGNSNQRSEG